MRRQKEAKSLFVQGLSECWVCIGAVMLFASAEEQNEQEGRKRTIIKLEKRQVQEECGILP